MRRVYMGWRQARPSETAARSGANVSTGAPGNAATGRPVHRGAAFGMVGHLRGPRQHRGSG